MVFVYDDGVIMMSESFVFLISVVFVIRMSVCVWILRSKETQLMKLELHNYVLHR